MLKKDFDSHKSVIFMLPGSRLGKIGIGAKKTSIFPECDFAGEYFNILLIACRLRVKTTKRGVVSLVGFHIGSVASAKWTFDVLMYLA